MAISEHLQGLGYEVQTPNPQVTVDNLSAAARDILWGYTQSFLGTNFGDWFTEFFLCTSSEVSADTLVRSKMYFGRFLDYWKDNPIDHPELHQALAIRIGEVETEILQLDPKFSVSFGTVRM